MHDSGWILDLEDWNAYFGRIKTVEYEMTVPGFEKHEMIAKQEMKDQ